MIRRILTALGLLFLWRHPGRSPYFLWPGGVLIVLGAAGLGSTRLIDNLEV